MQSFRFLVTYDECMPCPGCDYGLEISGPFRFGLGICRTSLHLTLLTLLPLRLSRRHRHAHFANFTCVCAKLRITVSQEPRRLKFSFGDVSYSSNGMPLPRSVSLF